MHLPNTTRIAYFYGSSLLFSVDIPLGTPVPRSGDYVEIPVSKRMLKISSMEYYYPTDLPGFTVYIKVKADFV